MNVKEKTFKIVDWNDISPIVPEHSYLWDVGNDSFTIYFINDPSEEDDPISKFLIEKYDNINVGDSILIG